MSTGEVGTILAAARASCRARRADDRHRKSALLAVGELQKRCVRRGVYARWNAKTKQAEITGDHLRRRFLTPSAMLDMAFHKGDTVASLSRQFLCDKNSVRKCKMVVSASRLAKQHRLMGKLRAVAKHPSPGKKKVFIRSLRWDETAEKVSIKFSNKLTRTQQESLSI